MCHVKNQGFVRGLIQVINKDRFHLPKFSRVVRDRTRLMSLLRDLPSSLRIVNTSLFSIFVNDLLAYPSLQEPCEKICHGEGVAQT